MFYIEGVSKTMVTLIQTVYQFLWGDLITLPLPGGAGISFSLLVLLLIPTGIYFTLRTRFLSLRLFKDMLRVTLERKDGETTALSACQTLVVSTATRVGMGNLVGVVAAISAGGAGAVFWMWVTALLGSTTAFIEATLAQLYKEEDPLYGGYRGGPAYYMHKFFQKNKKQTRWFPLSVLFAISGLICWCGISQVISNSVASSFENAFNIPPLYSTIVLVILGAVIVLRKNATVKALDAIVPVMAGLYLLITVGVILLNIGQIPAVLERIFSEAFGLRQAVAGGIGAVIMNGVKRGLFSNEAGSGSAPCAAATAKTDHPAKVGLVQALGVFIDTIVICTMTGLSIVITETWNTGLEGVAITTAAFQKGLPFPAQFASFALMLCLVFFAFTTILGWDYYGERCLEYLFNRNMTAVKTYRWLYIICVFFGPYMTVAAVWNIADIFNALMAFPNLIALLALSGVVVKETKDFFKKHKNYE